MLTNATRLSNRQFNLLRECQKSNGISLTRMLEISQTTAGSIFRRKLFNWSPSQQLFLLSVDGKDVLEQFSYTNVDRKNHRLPLSKFAPAMRTSKKQKVA